MKCGKVIKRKQKRVISLPERSKYFLCRLVFLAAGPPRCDLQVWSRTGSSGGSAIAGAERCRRGRKGAACLTVNNHSEGVSQGIWPELRACAELRDGAHLAATHKSQMLSLLSEFILSGARTWLNWGSRLPSSFIEWSPSPQTEGGDALAKTRLALWRPPSTSLQLHPPLTLHMLTPHTLTLCWVTVIWEQEFVLLWTGIDARVYMCVCLCVNELVRSIHPFILQSYALYPLGCFFFVVC